jgi:hypothetical protein
MIKEVKTYICDWPTDEVIHEVLDNIVKPWFYVRLEWVHTYSGKHSVMIDSNDSFEDVKNRLPKIYGM